MANSAKSPKVFIQMASQALIQMDSVCRALKPYVLINSGPRDKYLRPAFNAKLGGAGRKSLFGCTRMQIASAAENGWT